MFWVVIGSGTEIGRNNLLEKGRGETYTPGFRNESGANKAKRKTKQRSNRSQSGTQSDPKTRKKVPTWTQINQKGAKMEYKTANRTSRGCPCEKERKTYADLSAFWIPFWSKIQ